MNKFHKHIIGLFAILVLFSCKEEEQYDTILPKEYFPAYPGSYWVYSNGVTKTTDVFYQLHYINGEDVYVPEYDGKTVVEYLVGGKEIINFEENVWTVGEFDAMDVYRQIINFDTALYITQFPYNDLCDITYVEITSIPIDTLYHIIEVPDCDNYEFCDTILTNCDAGGCDTIYYTFTEEIIYQDTLIIDTLITNCDSISFYDSVIVVKEFVSSLDEIDCWFYKDYYARNIGLIKREVASCSDSTAYITEFELVKYHINK